MREVTSSTAFTVSKRELLTNGIAYITFPAINALKDKIEKDLVNMIFSDLKDVDNNFQFILTIKKLENSEI
jgi:hypothetical protein